MIIELNNKSTLLTLALASASLLSSTASYALDNLTLKGLIELQLSQVDGLDNHNDGGTGKFRFDEDNNGSPQIGTLGLAAKYDFNVKSQLHLNAIYNHDQEREIAITEAFWSFRPGANGAWRSQHKLGAFYAPLSTENIATLWTSPFSVTPSVINSWIGEELRTIGWQGQWKRLGRYSGSPHNFSFTTAIFGFNDPTGALLAWRGWAKTDRQTGLGQAVPIAALPTLQPGLPFDRQAQEIAPFREVDNRPGFYLAAQWQYLRDFSLSWLYYDNQADGAAFEDGQYAWHTHFHHLSFNWKISPSWRLLGQLIDGRTRMGANDEVNAPFEAQQLQLIKKIQRHRLSLMLESFAVQDEDNTAMDSNNERGKSTSLSWSYRPDKNWQWTLQASYIDSERRQRMYQGLDTSQQESQLLASSRYYF